MKIYTFYIEDDRYGVRTLLTSEFADDASAVASIPRLFAHSEHYLAIELLEGDRQVVDTPRPVGDLDDLFRPEDPPPRSPAGPAPTHRP